jgi:flagellar biosynthetic protein FliP
VTRFLRSWGAGLLILGIFAFPAHAQDVSIALGDENLLSAKVLQLLALITVLSLAPGLAVMVTCFPFVVTVLSILRQAIGLQQAPPNMLIISLALFLTYFVMDPVFRQAWEVGLEPLSTGDLTLQEAFPKILQPFRVFMTDRLDLNTYEAMQDLRSVDPTIAPVDSPISILIPSFILSELERAFQIGFLIFLPFLIIDLVVAAILMSMGMMMVPPAIVSLPFKLAFFAVADGWSLIANALVRSYF